MTRSSVPPALREPLAAFSAAPDSVLLQPLGSGNINDTWLVEEAGRRIVLQRINSVVFPRPRQVIENFRRLTEHISARQEAGGRSLVCSRLVPTRTGDAGFRDESGQWWRAQTYIEQQNRHRRALSPRESERLGRVLALFHGFTSDLDPEHLYRPLPDFHVTPVYLATYEASRRQYGRRETTELLDCFRQIERMSPGAAVLEDARGAGRLSLGIIHGDPKLDNVIRGEDGLAVGLFDLDTAGPGLVHYDLGDCLRSVCNRAGESPGILADIRFDAGICRSVLKGYLETVENSLGEWGRYYLYDAVLTITFELALRFLTDYLRGNVYFKVNDEEDNLFKARVQLALASSIVDQEVVIRDIAENR